MERVTLLLEIIDAKLALATIGALYFFGCYYNRLVEELESNGHDRGFMSLLVVVGVAVTGIGYSIVVNSIEHLLVLVGCFVASGIPMIVGSIKRYNRCRAQEEAESKAQAKASFDK